MADDTAACRNKLSDLQNINQFLCRTIKLDNYSLKNTENYTIPQANPIVYVIKIIKADPILDFTRS